MYLALERKLFNRFLRNLQQSYLLCHDRCLQTPAYNDQDETAGLGQVRLGFRAFCFDCNVSTIEDTVLSFLHNHNEVSEKVCACVWYHLLKNVGTFLQIYCHALSSNIVLVVASVRLGQTSISSVYNRLLTTYNIIAFRYHPTDNSTHITTSNCICIQMDVFMKWEIRIHANR